MPWSRPGQSAVVSLFGAQFPGSCHSSPTLWWCRKCHSCRRYSDALPAIIYAQTAKYRCTTELNGSKHAIDLHTFPEKRRYQQSRRTVGVFIPSRGGKTDNHCYNTDRQTWYCNKPHEGASHVALFQAIPIIGLSSSPATS